VNEAVTLSPRGAAVPAYYDAAQELPARLAPSLGAGWPRPEHQLLLTAACAPQELARVAWQRWRARPHAGDLSRIDAATARLFARLTPRARQLGLRDALFERGASMYRHTWCTNQLRIRGALHAVRALDGCGVRSLALKGLALLGTEYQDLGLRPMFDIDLLIEQERLGLALRSLSEAGWRSVTEPLSAPLLQGAVPHGYSFQLARGKVELDLHWHTLSQDASATFDRALWTHAVSDKLAGHEVWRPNATELLLVVCLHGVVWSAVPSAFWAADACELIRRAPEAIDWQRLTSLAVARRLTLPLYDALRFLAQVLKVEVPRGVLDGLGATQICELESLEYAAVARGLRDSTLGERWAMRELSRRRREERLDTRESSTPPPRATSEPAPVMLEVTGHALPAARDDSRARLVSCLCVTENRHAFIPWLLWCYDRQVYPHRELIIVDSSEPALSLPERPDIRVVRAELGAALGHKRNLALQAARGDLLAWFDDDDWQHPERLSVLVEKLGLPTTPPETTHAGPARGWFVDLFGQGATEYHGPGFALFNGSLFVGRNVRNHAFADELRSAEDTCWLRSLCHGQRSLAYSQGLPPLFFWLCHDKNTSNPRTARGFERRLDELREAIGDGWGDTDAQLAGLRARLGHAACLPSASNPTTASARFNPTTSTPRLWVVTPCMGRLSFLRRTMPLILEHPSVKQCVVDYSCPDQCGAWIQETFPEALRSGRCVVEQVTSRNVFNKSAAHNAGARRALAEGAEYLCFLDADTVVAPGFFDWLLPRLKQEQFLVAARRGDHDVPSLTGLLVLSATKFVETDGFDESFLGWGSEDIEMRLRLHVLHGLDYGDVPLSFVHPLPHGDTLRSCHYEEKDIQRSDQRNFSRMLQKLHAWRRDRNFDRSSAARLFYKPPPASFAPAHAELASPPALEAQPMSLAPTELVAQGVVVTGSCVHDAATCALFDGAPSPSLGRRLRVHLYAACFAAEPGADELVPFRPELVRQPTPYFEHDALVSVLETRAAEWASSDYVGVQALRAELGGADVWVAFGRELVATQGAFDVYAAPSPNDASSLWRSLGAMETRARDLAYLLLTDRLRVSKGLLARRVAPIHSNTWIARPRVFERFVREWLIPARAALEDRTDRRIQALLAPPSRATSLPRPPEPWLRRAPSGQPHLGLHPYVLERLAPLFFVDAGYRVRTFKPPETSAA
jgi:glycosyltransferase involved in cell wall biosynthesis